MAPSHNDDLDWLYRRDKKHPRDQEPEPTRVLPKDQPAADESTPSPPRTPPQGAGQVPPRTPRPGPPPTQPPGPPRAPRRKSAGKRIAVGIGIFLVAVLVWLIAVPIYAWSHVDRVAWEPSGSRPPTNPARSTCWSARIPGQVSPRPSGRSSAPGTSAASAPTRSCCSTCRRAVSPL
ncbi:hypothetical protein [Microlunatus sp. Gsoil 973]|uniref:hypothetical protein n=1 Tax=Microlunatus sp. Gsoil 973 TaxID=2672569 RepID=UPI001E2AC85C|nr:hypothetical protein [Microlunatus sp. Gsoil 973]